MSQSERASFGSKIGMVLATAGGAVGLGNVWRFPYMAGENGGAAFIVIYIGCVLLLGMPCMINEFIIGRHAASNTARAYSKLSNGKAWKWGGMLGVLTGFLITGYYAVVSGWCMAHRSISNSSSPTSRLILGSRWFGPWRYSLSPISLLFMASETVLSVLRR